MSASNTALLLCRLQIPSQACMSAGAAAAGVQTSRLAGYGQRLSSPQAASSALGPAICTQQQQSGQPPLITLDTSSWAMQAPIAVAGGQRGVERRRRETGQGLAP
jgi:hypothetical protein